jgi:pyruvate/2-oxoglutarate dehydrogenase complex dihydrolipoamide acyltransferase (E2) component
MCSWRRASIGAGSWRPGRGSGPSGFSGRVAFRWFSWLTARAPRAAPARASARPRGRTAGTATPAPGPASRRTRRIARGQQRRRAARRRGAPIRPEAVHSSSCRRKAATRRGSAFDSEVSPLRGSRGSGGHGRIQKPSLFSFIYPFTSDTSEANGAAADTRSTAKGESRHRSGWPGSRSASFIAWSSRRYRRAVLVG